MNLLQLLVTQKPRQLPWKACTIAASAYNGFAGNRSSSRIKQKTYCSRLDGHWKKWLPRWPNVNVESHIAPKASGSLNGTRGLDQCKAVCRSSISGVAIKQTKRRHRWKCKSYNQEIVLSSLALPSLIICRVQTGYRHDTAIPAVPGKRVQKESKSTPRLAS